MEDEDITGQEFFLRHMLRLCFERCAVGAYGIAVNTVDDVDKATGVHALGREPACKIVHAEELFRRSCNLFGCGIVYYWVRGLNGHRIRWIDDRDGAVRKLHRESIRFFFPHWPHLAS